MTDDIRRYSYDVVLIGAGGSGLRAAIEARLCGKKTAVISKSLFGKAHTVMAEGGCAAAMGNVNPMAPVTAGPAKAAGGLYGSASAALPDLLIAEMIVPLDALGQAGGTPGPGRKRRL